MSFQQIPNRLATQFRCSDKCPRLSRVLAEYEQCFRVEMSNIEHFPQFSRFSLTDGSVAHVNKWMKLHRDHQVAKTWMLFRAAYEHGNLVRNAPASEERVDVLIGD